MISGDRDTGVFNCLGGESLPSGIDTGSCHTPFESSRSNAVMVLLVIDGMGVILITVFGGCQACEGVRGARGYIFSGR